MSSLSLSLIPNFLPRQMSSALAVNAHQSTPPSPSFPRTAEPLPNPPFPYCHPEVMTRRSPGTRIAATRLIFLEMPLSFYLLRGVASPTTHPTSSSIGQPPHPSPSSSRRTRRSHPPSTGTQVAVVNHRHPAIASPSGCVPPPFTLARWWASPRQCSPRTQWPASTTGEPPMPTAITSAMAVVTTPRARTTPLAGTGPLGHHPCGHGPHQVGCLPAWGRW
jgi:hypothetical protein